MKDIIKIITARFKGAKIVKSPVSSGEAQTDSVQTPFFYNQVLETRIIAITNQKGGCGKTTTAVNLSACLAQKGYRVLLIDLDSQGHASLGLGIEIDSMEKSIYDCLIHNFDLEKIIRSTEVEGLDVAPANSLLSGAPLELANLLGREGVLKVAIRRMVNKRYDYILVDCAPSLSLLTINALAAANFVLIPIQVHYYSLQGMKELFSTIDIVKERLNCDLEILGILPTLFDIRIKISHQILGQISSYFKDMLFKTIIHSNVKLTEAPIYKKPIHIYNSQSRGAKDYIGLAEEIVTRLEQRQSLKVGLGELVDDG